jgi:hypothetical protein
MRILYVAAMGLLPRDFQPSQASADRGCRRAV